MSNTPTETPRTSLTFGQYPSPPDDSVEALREQLRQLTLMVSSQQEVISQLQGGSSGASAPSPGNPSSSPAPVPDAASAADLISALTDTLRRATVDADPNVTANRELAGRAATLSNLLKNAPKYEGLTDVFLFKKRITEYMRRRNVTDEVMKVDILQEACQKGASDYLGSLEWPIENTRDFWHALETRYARDPLSRMADYDNLKQRQGQSYRKYADIMLEKSYGLNIPREALLRKYLQTMLHGQELRRFLVPHLNQYDDVRALAAAVEQLTQDEPTWATDAKPSSSTSKCRICGKSGHFAAACPTKKRAAPTRTPTVPAAAEAELEAEQEADAEYEVIEEEFLEDYEQEVAATDMQAWPAEKRAAPQQEQHRDMIKRLRSLRPVRASGEGPSNPPAQATTTLPPPPPRQPQRPAATTPIGATQQRTERLTAVPLRGYRAPAPQGNRPVVHIARAPAASKSLKKSLEGNVDVPATTLVGLVLKASTNPQRLVNAWLQQAEQEVKDLTPNATAFELEDNMLEIDAADTKQVVINPLTTKEGITSRYVGYLPLKLGNNQELFWALADTGAQVSVISAGLAAYLNLYREDMSNVHPATFSVTGYNGMSSYMPVLETTVRLGARGGSERYISMHFCILDTNAYKLIVGVDLLNQLKFVYDGPGRRIHLENQSIRFTLPLATKDYAFSASAVRAYREAAEKLQAGTANALDEVDISMTDCHIDEAMAAAEEAQYDNALSATCRCYVNLQNGLEPLLYLAQLGYETEDSSGTSRVSESLCGSTVSLSDTAELPTATETLAVSLNDAPPLDEPLSKGVTSSVTLSEATVSLSEATLLSVPAASQISAAQFEVCTVLPQQSEAGDMGTAALPQTTAPSLSPEELQTFLSEYDLVPCEGKAPLAVRAAKLREAITSNALLVDPSRSAAEKKQAYQMLLAVADVFATSIMDLAVPAKGDAFTIDTGSATPIKARPFKMGRKEVEFLNVTILGQLDASIVRRSQSPWSSPAFVAYARPYWSDSKPKARKVIDYRKINRVTRSDTYPLPDIPELLEWLSQAKYFGAIDLKSGYWQKLTHPNDVCKTAFVTPGGLHEYLRVPFGLKNAPAFFQRAITTLLTSNNIQHSRGFVDDLLTGGQTWQEYLQHQKELFQVLRDNSWLVTISKVRLGYNEIQALGHLIGHQYVKPDPEKVSAIGRIARPANVGDVRAFIGLVGYYRKFIKNFAKIAKPLTALTSKDIPFTWTDIEQHAFETLQRQLSEATILKTPTSTGKFKVYTDYCSEALGAALHQLQNGVEEPIAFASRLCKGPETTLSSAEGELCALVYALGKFRPYLGFEEFEVVTDSSALLSLHSNQNLSSKLTRWSILLSEFNFKIVHKPGSSHKNADGLSRCPQDDELNSRQQLHIWQLAEAPYFLKDDKVSCQGASMHHHDYQSAILDLHALRVQLRTPCIMCGGEPRQRMLMCGRCGASQHATCCPRRPAPCYWYCPPCMAAIQREGPTDITEDVPLLLYLLGGERPPALTVEAAENLRAFYSIRRGQLMIEAFEGYRVFPTPYERQHLIEHHHYTLMHAGWRAVTEALKAEYYWPGLEMDVKQFCKACLSCQLESAVFRRQDVLSGHLSASRPRVSWSLDCAPSIKTTRGDRVSILIAVDDFTRYVLCALLPRLDSRSVKRAFMERILMVYGRPDRIRTDGGREFAGEFSELLATLQIQRIQTRTISPWTNGRAERMVRHVKSLLRRSLFANSADDWEEMLPWVVAAINQTVSRTTGFAPHEVFFGEAPRPLLSTSRASVDVRLGEESAQSVDTYVRYIKRQLRQLQDEARTTQQQYEAGLEVDYRDYPVAGGQYATDNQVAKKAPFQQYEKGQLVMLKRMKGSLGQHNTHFALSAAGPYVVVDVKHDSLLLQDGNGHRKWQNKANCLPLRPPAG